MRLDFSNSWQVMTFFYSLVLGVALRAVYDLIRYSALHFKRRKSVIIFSDILFFFISGIVTFCFFMLFSKGVIRVYVFFGTTVGFIICKFTLSKIIRKILKIAENVLAKIYSLSSTSAMFLIKKMESVTENLKKPKKKTGKEL